MKTIFKFLGAIFLAVILTIAGVQTFAWYQSSQYEETAVPYLNTAVPEISKWKTAIVREYMAPEAVEKISDEQFAGIIKNFSRLGNLITMDDPEFERLYTGSTAQGGEKKALKYTIDTVYENGDAVITVVLLALGDSFQVYKFDINSMALAK